MKPTEQACLIEWRADLLKGVDGKVLEIGAGTGASLALYPNNSSLELYLAEPDHNMRSQLAEKVNASNLSNVAILACPSEAIESEDNFYDHVFVSLVCCSVNDVEASLQEIKRVMKPGGRFIFLEHVAAEEGTKRRKWQGRVNFLWRKLAGNCHLNRETEKHIKQAGFIITEIKRESMRKSMPLVRPTIRGIARLS
ncbi:class I SAM-dependent methyltransferase [Sinobacterium caligoides]|nr:class I SAM-dependent methyltransferase [Sinobacterium caligoides]